MASLEDLTPEARDELAALARELADNPATREGFLRLTKTARPNMPIGEIDLKDDMSSRFDVAQSRMEQLEGKLRERDALEELERRRNRLVRGKGVKEEDIAEIEKIMLEKGITSHESAADYYNWMRQAATPTPQKMFSRNVIDDAAQNTLKRFMGGNHVRAAREVAAEAFNEIRKSPRPIGL
jgi:hypothetical protein